MPQQVIPLDSSPNQNFRVDVSVNSSVLSFFVALRYNEIQEYWTMSLYNANLSLLIDSLPLLTGLNLLQQFGYMGIGSLYVVNVSGPQAGDSPNNTNLGTDFQLVWADNLVVVSSLTGSTLGIEHPARPYNGFGTGN